MRIYAVTSIHLPSEEIVRRQQRYDLLSPPDVTVELHDIGPDAPRTLDSVDDIRESERLVAQALRAVDDAGYDALLPDCILDPSVAELSGVLNTPVHGLLWLTLEHIDAAGQSAGVVTSNRLIADAFTARAEEYGRARTLVSASVLDLGLDELAEDTRWLAALGKAVNELVDAGAEIVINGCAAVELVNARSGRVPVIDPTTMAMQRLAA
jgi:Asp/Glu/hydantoin racemase